MTVQLQQADERRRQVIVVASVFVLMSVSTGCGFYGLAIFARDLVDRHGFDLGTTAVGSTTFLIGSGVGDLWCHR